MLTKNKLLAVLALTLATPAFPAEEADSSAVGLAEFVVTAHRPVAEIIPAQVLGGAELKRLNSNSVADALRYFSGVQVKDYGGVGGIKTVNIRSMGSNHTGVVYDGVELGNAQNGQIDLGQFSLDNMEAISLYNGQKSRILQPAKDFGSAGTIYMRTKQPLFQGRERFHGRLTFRTGSFDLINPSALVEVKLSNSVNAQLSAEWVHSSGKYKFRYMRKTPDGKIAYDTTAVRQNGDINATRVELNLNGNLRNGSWRAKAYNYNSERGVPGAIVNNVWRRGERIWDNNTFAQASYTGYFGKFTTLNNAKYAYYHTHYVNNDDKVLKVDNIYRQSEVYLSTANEYEIQSWWRASASYDFQWNALETNIKGFTRPDRFAHMLSVATAFDFRRVKVQASLLGHYVHDRLKGRQASKDKKTLSPAVFAFFNPLRSPDLGIRAFYKKTFRMPTFNDLYYTDMGNTSLNPERVTQYNVGVVFERSLHAFVSSYRISADAYINRVKDKIVAYPKGQQFRWAMLNLGLVDIKGVDVSGQITVEPYRELFLTLRGQYTFQRAIDITNPSDSYYRHQIPYIPHHSGSAVLNATWRRWSLNYSFIYVGERYNQQENIQYNHMQPWYTSDLSLSRDFRFGAFGLRAMLEVNNLLNQDYDVIVNYPMPKRNFRLTLSLEI